MSSNFKEWAVRNLTLGEPTSTDMAAEPIKRALSFGVNNVNANVPAGSRAVVFLDKDDSIEYCPNAEFERMWRPLASRLPWVLMSTVFVGLALAQFHLLDPVILGLARILIVPLKAFLMSEPTGLAASFLSWAGPTAYWSFSLVGVGLAITAVRRAELPNRIGYNASNLYLTQMQSHGRHYVCRAVPWQSVGAVQVNRPAATKSVDDYVIQLGYGNGTLNIKYGDIWKPSERDMFLKLLKSQIPATAFGDHTPEEVFSVFKPVKDSQNFTELWLKELSAPTKREKLAPLAPGVRLQNGEYCIERKLGTGGQATVYLATMFQHSGKPQIVALKEFVMPVFPDARVRKTVAEKFQQEAAMLSRLTHPQIVKLLDVFIEDHRAYLVLERIEGNTLKHIVGESGAMLEREAARLGIQMCDILLYLHSQNPPVIHRDFTPDNLMLTDGELRLIDFSVAQQVEINITGSVVGKHLYMAPEQFRGKTGVESDVYSFGATLYFLLTGHEPEAISVSRPSKYCDQISERMNGLVSDCTALDPEKRYKDLSRVRAELSLIAQASVA